MREAFVVISSRLFHKPAEVAAKIDEFIKAGIRDVNVDIISAPAERNAQHEQFAKEVIPLLRR